MDKLKSLKVSKILRYSALGILLLMLVLAVVAQFYEVPLIDNDAQLEATVQSGVDARLTQIAAQTGPPNPEQLEATIEQRAEATLTAIVAPPTTPTPVPPTIAEDAPASQIDLPPFVQGIWDFVSGVAGAFFGIFAGLWNFAGRAGLFIQLFCCVVPVLLIVVGIAND